MQSFTCFFFLRSRAICLLPSIAGPCPGLGTSLQAPPLATPPLHRWRSLTAPPPQRKRTFVFQQLDKNLFQYWVRKIAGFLAVQKNSNSLSRSCVQIFHCRCSTRRGGVSSIPAWRAGSCGAKSPVVLWGPDYPRGFGRLTSSELVRCQNEFCIFYFVSTAKSGDPLNPSLTPAMVRWLRV